MKIKHKKLKEWIGAGLITAEQGDAIHNYEEQKRGGRFGRGLVGLALFSILMGVLSIIASNWHAIPGEVKIGVHVLLNLGIGAFALWADRHGKDMLRECATLAFMGLTFTLIVLTGQIYQLDGSAGDATIFWFVITLPFFALMGKTYMTAVPWMIAFITTLSFVLFDKLSFLEDKDQGTIVLAATTLLPLAFMAKGAMPSFIRHREALAALFLRTGFLVTAISASCGLISWQILEYIPDDYEFMTVRLLVILIAGLAGIAAHALYHKFYKTSPELRGGAIFAAISLLCMIIPLLTPQIGSDLLGAVTFIGYWIFIGWVAQVSGKMRIVSFAILIIAIRIFVAYVELFGSLMQTGVGMIIGGIVLLALMYGAKRANAFIKTQGAGAHGKA